VNRHVLLIDNYDSFSFNLVQALRQLGAEVTVRRNDETGLDGARALAPTHLVVSPGPGRPEEAGISMALIQDALGRVPVLGVCLGHQALAAVLGGTVGPARSLCHGKASPVYHDARTLYQGLPSPFPAGRYHSLTVAEEGLPAGLAISAYTSDGEIMGVRHRRFTAEGVQFHPESVLTPHGAQLLANFLELEGGERVA
jgi:para-aminobenzoate synthetase component 2